MRSGTSSTGTTSSPVWLPAERDRDRGDGRGRSEEESRYGFRLLVGFGPWIVYWILSGSTSFDVAIGIAFGIAVLSKAINLARHKPLVVLDVGNMFAFAALAIIGLAAGDAWVGRWIQPLGNAVGALAFSRGCEGVPSMATPSCAAARMRGSPWPVTTNTTKAAATCCGSGQRDDQGVLAQGDVGHDVLLRSLDRAGSAHLRAPGT